MPDVSVVIPVHNGAAYINRAVLSVLAQSLADLEVLVVDDCSTDETPSLIEELAERDPRVRPLRTDCNGGPSAARNLGIRHARSRWVAILDADDWFEPDRLRTLVSRGDETNADFVSDNLLVWSEENETGVEMFTAEVPLPETISAESFVLGNLPDYKNPRRSLGFLKPLMRQTFLRQHDIRYDEAMRFAEDYKLYLESLLSGCVWVTVSSAHYAYVVRGDSLTATHKAEDLAKLCAVDEMAMQHPTSKTSPVLRAALRRHHISSQQRLHWVLFYTSVKAHRFRQALASASANVHVLFFILRNCLDQLRIRTNAYVFSRAGGSR